MILPFCQTATNGMDGVLHADPARHREIIFRVSGVSTKPGETTVTAIPFGSQSRRSVSANQVNAALEAP